MMGELIEKLREASTHPSALPHIASSIKLQPVHDAQITVAPSISIDGIQPILGFTCVIEYEGRTRLITCRRYDIKGTLSYVGAICHSAGGYRQFRTDRIEAVIDPATGEVIGGSSFFTQFEASSSRPATDNWGLTSSRKSTLVAGLNILAFIARCDGHWHPLEHEPIERFITSMWLRKEWEGDPPVERIISHAQRLAPGAHEALAALKYYARSRTSTRVLSNAIAELITADGVIHAEEDRWAAEILAEIEAIQEADFRKYVGESAAVMIRITS